MVLMLDFKNVVLPVVVYAMPVTMIAQDWNHAKIGVGGSTVSTIDNHVNAIVPNEIETTITMERPWLWTRKMACDLL